MIRSFLVIAVLFSSPAFSEVSFERLAAISETPDSLEGRFVQEKYLKVLEAGLVSSGVFSYKKGEHLRWETLEPISNKLVLTPTSVVTKQDEKELVALPAGASTVTSVLSEILFSVLTANWNNLSKYFELSGDVDNGSWRVELLPTDVTIAAAISKIELSGETLLQKIILYEKQGDSTTIEFFDQQQ